MQPWLQDRDDDVSIGSSLGCDDTVDRAAVVLIGSSLGCNDDADRTGLNRSEVALVADRTWLNRYIMW
jgi:hypothetical protein